MNIKKITLLGAGNVAWHIGKAFKQKGYIFNQVFSNQFKNAQQLSAVLKADPTDDLSKINLNADIYILALKDDVLEEVGRKLNLFHKFVVHTSGAQRMDILSNLSTKYGVLYPLQTFTKNTPVDFKNVPILIDANEISLKKELEALARTITENVQKVTDKDRLAFHIAAVFVNNFANYLYGTAYNILNSNQQDFKMLQPLIEETVRKLKEADPQKIQTGPAARGDMETIQKHLKFLQDHNPEYVQIYGLLSEKIQELKKNE